VIVRWTPRAAADLRRLHDFLEPRSPRAAKAVAEMLGNAPNSLKQFPRRGARLEGFEGREVRRLIVGSYEIRYEIVDEVIRILQIWHGKEDR
jgi:plasmid stabilization system protein ParE